MKKIKYLTLLLLCFGMVISSWGCSDDDKTEPELKVSTETINFSKTAETKVMHIKTNTSWSIESSETWCTVTPSSGNETGTLKLEVSVTANTTLDVRNATLTVLAGGIAKQVAIVQAHNDLLVVKKSEYEVEAAGEEITVELQVSSPHTIKINADWIIQSVERAATDVTEKFTIKPNTAFTDRQGTIDFTVGDLIETVIIKQKGILLTIPADKTGMTDDALVLAKKMGIGWNLGNSLEACSATSASETMWGNPATTKTLIDAIKAAGFTTVRIPCAWSGYIENQETYKIKDSWLARVKEVVDYCIDNNMYAILNIHWDGGWLEENPSYDKQEEVNKKQKALWEQIAVYFRDYDEHLLFAGTNEVHAGYGNPSTENIEVQLSYNKTFVDAIRSTGGRNTWRNIIVQAYNTNIDLAVKYLTMPQDINPNRMMAEVHYYDPWDFCGEETSDIFLWGKDFTASNVSSWGQEDWADQAFGSMKTGFVDKGYPVILGEYGAILRFSLSSSSLSNHLKARNYYLNYITRSALDNGLVPVYWDNGNTGNNGFGLFDRSTGEKVHADAIDAIINAGK